MGGASSRASDVPEPAVSLEKRGIEYDPEESELGFEIETDEGNRASWETGSDCSIPRRSSSQYSVPSNESCEDYWRRQRRSSTSRESGTGYPGSSLETLKEDEQLEVRDFGTGSSDFYKQGKISHGKEPFPAWGSERGSSSTGQESKAPLDNEPGAWGGEPYEKALLQVQDTQNQDFAEDLQNLDAYLDQYQGALQGFGYEEEEAGFASREVTPAAGSRMSEHQSGEWERPVAMRNSTGSQAGASQGGGTCEPPSALFSSSFFSPAPSSDRMSDRRSEDASSHRHRSAETTPRDPGMPPAAHSPSPTPPRGHSSEFYNPPESSGRIRISMDVAGGGYASWRGNVGAPERMSLQVSANVHQRPSDTSSGGTIEELPPNFPLTAIPPQPSQTPSRPMEELMKGAWEIPPPPAPKSSDVGPPAPRPGMKGSGQSKGVSSSKQAEVGSGPLQGDFNQAMAHLDIRPGPGSAISQGSDPGSRTKAGGVRSSFAADRKSMEIGQQQSSIDMFKGVTEDGSVSLMSSDSLADELCRRYHQLAVLPAEVPVPLTLLARVWGTPDLHDTEAAAAVMESKRVLKMAVLEDDSSWCLLSPTHLARLKENYADQLPQMHSRLVNLYRQGFHDLALVPDDNYFMQNIANHLVEADRLEELAELLKDPIWLETKLRSYGPGAVVSDFRKFLVSREEADIKLLLRAFQISASASLDHPNLYILKEQMLGRLMVAAKGSALGEWYETARAECRMAVPHRRARNMPVHLLPRTPTLEQAGGLQRLILKGHEEGVRRVKLVPNGMEVVTVSADGSARLWDMEIGDCVLFMEEHEGPITCLDISSDGQTLVTGGEDCLAIVFDLPSGIWRHKLRGHTKRINAVAIDHQGRRIVTSSQDMTTRIWSMSKGNCLHVLSDFVGGQGFTWEDWAGHHTVAISPDCRLVATVDGEYRVRIWKMETGELTDTLEGHTDWIVALVYAGDSGKLVTASHDRTVRLWNLWTGVCDMVFQGHRGRVNNLKITPDGARAVSVSDDSSAMVWDLRTLERICELQGHGAWINDAAITHTGSKIVTVSGDDLAVVWDGNTGEVLEVLKGHTGEVNAVDLSYKGRFAITASEDGTARVWDLQAPPAYSSEHHQGKVTKALVSADNTMLITIGDDSAALVWDIQSSQCTKVLRGHQTGLNWVFLVANGTRLVTASGDRRVCVWDLITGECLKTLPEHRGSRMKSFSVCPEGKTAVIVLFDSTVSVWDLESMACTTLLIRRGERDGIRVHAGGVNAVYMCMNGTRAVTISKDSTGRVWDLAKGDCIMVLKGHEDVVSIGEVKEDGSLCLTAGYDKTARLWDLATGECVMVLDHPKEVDHIAVDPHWHRAVTIADRRTAWLWDIKKGRCLGVLEGHTDEICGAVFSGDSKFVATFSANSVVRVWTAHSGRLRAVYLGDSGITTCMFSSLGAHHTLCAGDGNGVVHFLEFPAEDLASGKHR